MDPTIKYNRVLTTSLEMPYVTPRFEFISGDYGPINAIINFRELPDSSFMILQCNNEPDNHHHHSHELYKIGMLCNNCSLVPFDANKHNITQIKKLYLPDFGISFNVTGASNFNSQLLTEYEKHWVNRKLPSISKKQIMCTYCNNSNVQGYKCTTKDASYICHTCYLRAHDIYNSKYKIANLLVLRTYQMQIVLKDAVSIYAAHHSNLLYPIEHAIIKYYAKCSICGTDMGVGYCCNDQYVCLKCHVFLVACQNAILRKCMYLCEIIPSDIVSRVYVISLFTFNTRFSFKV
jgi:hypothetical protein